MVVFGGLNAGQQLNSDRVDVTLIDRRNYHLFQPLLYQVATGSLAPTACSVSVFRQGFLGRHRACRRSSQHIRQAHFRICRLVGLGFHSPEAPRHVPEPGCRVCEVGNPGFNIRPRLPVDHRSRAYRFQLQPRGFGTEVLG